MSGRASPHLDLLEDLKDNADQRNVLDFHRFERDETVGNFLVRIAQQAKKNLEDVNSERQTKLQK